MKECCKCGYKGTVFETWSSLTYYKENVYFLTGAFKHIKEYLSETCRRCGYSFNRPCEDAKIKDIK